MTRPVKAKGVRLNKAKTNVTKAAPNIRGYPGFAIGNAVWLGRSGQENLFI
jgi:hypothetical protein